MIELTKTFILAKFNKRNGFNNDCEVIYGDTDSVMVRFGVKTVTEALALGKEAAEYVT